MPDHNPIRTTAFLLLAGLLLAGCGPVLSTPAPTPPPPTPLPTEVPATAVPGTAAPAAPSSPSTAAPTAPPPPGTATPTERLPVATPTPTSTPAPPSPLGLVQRWAWAPTNIDIIYDFQAQDFDGDGRPEIALASYNRRTYLVSAGGETLWEFDTGGSVFSLEIVDLNGDGIDEILAGSANGILFGFSGGGGVLWQVPLSGRVTAISTADLDSDGRPEILTGARPHEAWAFLADGTPLWRTDTPGAPTAFVELGGIHNRTLVLSTEEGAVQALDASGVPLWQDAGKGYVRDLAPFEGGVLAGSRSGDLAWFTITGDTALETSLGAPVPAIAAADLEGDGELEILAGLGDEENGLTALTPAGEMLWSTTTEHGVWAIALADLEGDGQPEIALGTDGGEIVILDNYGRFRGHTWVPWRVHGLLAVDLDGDGRDELLVRSSHHLYALAESPEGNEGQRQRFVETLKRWPEDTPLLAAGEEQVVLVAVGDIMIGRAVEPRMLMYGATYPFEPFLPVLSQADITTGNLECVLAHSGSPLQKTYTFRGHPALVSGLQESGFNLLTLANNHAMDFGTAALEETKEVLRQAGVTPMGAGPDAYDPVFMEVKGLRIAFLARTVAIYPQEGVPWGEPEEMRQAVAEAGQFADLVIVHLHGGIEYSPNADAAQRSLAQAAAEGGAALVIGHHSHSPQEIEWIGDTLVAYSLGDFVFDIDDYDIARDAAILRVVLSRDGVVGAEWIPGRIVDDVQPRPLPGEGGWPQVEVIAAP